jgi:hypothetical protein
VTKKKRSKPRPQLKVRDLERRILLSATWVEPVSTENPVASEATTAPDTNSIDNVFTLINSWLEDSPESSLFSNLEASVSSDPISASDATSKSEPLSSRQDEPTNQVLPNSMVLDILPDRNSSPIFFVENPVFDKIPSLDHQDPSGARDIHEIEQVAQNIEHLITDLKLSNYEALQSDGTDTANPEFSNASLDNLPGAPQPSTFVSQDGNAVDELSVSIILPDTFNLQNGLLENASESSTAIDFDREVTLTENRIESESYTGLISNELIVVDTRLPDYQQLLSCLLITPSMVWIM